VLPLRFQNFGLKINSEKTRIVSLKLGIAGAIQIKESKGNRIF
jgi:hypothetical protein